MHWFVQCKFRCSNRDCSHTRLYLKETVITDKLQTKKDTKTDFYGGFFSASNRLQRIDHPRKCHNIPIMLFGCQPKIFHKHCFSFSRGYFNSREKLSWRQCLCNILEGQKKDIIVRSTLWHFLERVNWKLRNKVINLVFTKTTINEHARSNIDS